MRKFRLCSNTNPEQDRRSGSAALQRRVIRLRRAHPAQTLPRDERTFFSRMRGKPPLHRIAQTQWRCENDRSYGAAAQRKKEGGRLRAPRLGRRRTSVSSSLRPSSLQPFLLPWFSILPSICHGILRPELSSQFVSCIESLKKIVKQKTRGKVWAPAVREGVQRSAAREQLRSE